MLIKAIYALGGRSVIKPSTLHEITVVPANKTFTITCPKFVKYTRAENRAYPPTSSLCSLWLFFYL